MVTKPLTHIEYPCNGTDGFGHQETRMMKALEQLVDACHGFLPSRDPR